MRRVDGNRVLETYFLQGRIENSRYEIIFQWQSLEGPIISILGTAK